MTQLSANPDRDEIAAAIGAVGRSFRSLQLARGAVYFAGSSILGTILAVLLAHGTGQSAWTTVILVTWLLGIAAGALYWLFMPMFRRPGAMELARLIESRVSGLHNGLTNSLLLQQRADLADSGWLPAIYAEIARNIRTRPVRQAITLKELAPVAQRWGLAVGFAIVVVAFMPGAFAHGWHQLFHPEAFIPKVGSAELIAIEPGDVTLVVGQPLEMTIRAKATGQAKARVYFQPAESSASSDTLPNMLELSAVTTMASEGGLSELTFTNRLDHLMQSAHYRVEVGGTQSRWYSANVVPEVKLKSLTLDLDPPPYTRLPHQSLDLLTNASNPSKPTINVAEGSRLHLTAKLDVPVAGAMLQPGNATPISMLALSDRQTFSADCRVSDDMSLAILVTDGAKQIIARLPDQPVVIHCVKDAPPVISMKWPTQDLTVWPNSPLKISALVRDDYGVSVVRVLASIASASTQPAEGGTAEPASTAGMEVVHEEHAAPGAGVAEPLAMTYSLDIPASLRVPGQSIRVQVEAADNRNISRADSSLLGPQTSRSPIYVIKFEDPHALALDEKKQADELRERLLALLNQQRALHDKTSSLLLAPVELPPGTLATIATIATGQTDLRAKMQAMADGFPFSPDQQQVKKTLLVLAVDPASDAVNFASALRTELLPKSRSDLSDNLQQRQRVIIQTLESLLSLLATGPQPTTEPAQHSHEDLLSQADAFKKLDEALKQYALQQQKLLNQTASLAKKPVDQWDDNDKKLAADLKMAQENLEAFMQQKVSDFSKNSEQDFSNPSLLKDLSQIYSETTMAKDALKAQAAEIAVADEENGLELAKEISSNVEKWLGNTPDRQQWTQEDPPGKTDTPMAELPKDLQDMVGQLLEQEEDLFEQMEDANANWADSLDKGAGMGAGDGPIANMTAKGVTGNTLPNNNEMNGRAGEGRSGKSQGEFVGDTAEGKGGRRTPTRLDPTPFEKGQIKDSGKDPSGGATGGGKLSGEGGEGLEGPVPPKTKAQMQRLAEKQAELRNTAERLNLKYRLDRYDNFKLNDVVILMRRVESDLRDNRYSNALRQRNVMLDDLNASKTLLAGEVNVQQDTTPQASQKLRSAIDDAMKGELPPAWSDALKAYYQKLGEN